MPSAETNRRELMMSGVAAGAGLAAAASGGTAASAQTATHLPDPFVPVAMPAAVPAKDGMLQVPGARLWYWDTGGSGQPVVLLHPASGSALIWGYQQPALAKAGYRVISYSRRGHYKSDPVAKDAPGSAAGDLRAVADGLGLGRFHAVGSAAGVGVAMDFALAFPERLASLVYSCGTGGIVDDSYARMLDGLRPKGFSEMPTEFQELGPSYRAANPDGVKAWVALEHQAHSGAYRGQKPLKDVTLAALEKMMVPTLVIAGDADLWWPPAALRIVAARLPRRETLIVPEAGHSVYWETPELFNRAVLDFIGRHPV